AIRPERARAHFREGRPGAPAALAARGRQAWHQHSGASDQRPRSLPPERDPRSDRGPLLLPQAAREAGAGLMPMPAFDMEPGSTSPPDGNPAPPSPDDAVVGPPPPGAETAPAKPPNGGTVPGKPPTASLISITGKAKPAPSKAGDLTRL